MEIAGEREISYEGLWTSTESRTFCFFSLDQGKCIVMMYDDVGFQCSNFEEGDTIICERFMAGSFMRNHDDSGKKSFYLRWIPDKSALTIIRNSKRIVPSTSASLTSRKNTKAHFTCQRRDVDFIEILLRWQYLFEILSLTERKFSLKLLISPTPWLLPFVDEWERTSLASGATFSLTSDTSSYQESLLEWILQNLFPPVKQLTLRLILKYHFRKLREEEAQGKEALTDVASSIVSMYKYFRPFLVDLRRTKGIFMLSFSTSHLSEQGIDGKCLLIGFLEFENGQFMLRGSNMNDVKLIFESSPSKHDLIGHFYHLQKYELFPRAAFVFVPSWMYLHCLIRRKERKRRESYSILGYEFYENQGERRITSLLQLLQNLSTFMFNGKKADPKLFSVVLRVESIENCTEKSILLKVISPYEHVQVYLQHASMLGSDCTFSQICDVFRTRDQVPLFLILYDWQLSYTVGFPCRISFYPAALVAGDTNRRSSKSSLQYAFHSFPHWLPDALNESYMRNQINDLKDDSEELKNEILLHTPEHHRLSDFYQGHFCSPFVPFVLYPCEIISIAYQKNSALKVLIQDSSATAYLLIPSFIEEIWNISEESHFESFLMEPYRWKFMVRSSEFWPSSDTPNAGGRIGEKKSLEDPTFQKSILLHGNKKIILNTPKKPTFVLLKILNYSVPSVLSEAYSILSEI